MSAVYYIAQNTLPAILEGLSLFELHSIRHQKLGWCGTALLWPQNRKHHNFGWEKDLRRIIQITLRWQQAL